MAILKFDSGPRSGEAVSLDKDRTVFGRNTSCDCVLKHPTVSREHFYVERNCGKLFVVDLNSGNGTFANGSRVTWVELKDGDRIQAGPFTLIVEAPGGERARPRAAEDLKEDLTEQPQFCESHQRMYPREYLEGIRQFNARRYFEAHESWEEVWLRSSDDTKIFYQMLIQAAVGLHHYERGNARGARGMYRAVTEKLPRLPLVFMSLDTESFARQFKEFFADLTESAEDVAPPPARPRPTITLLGGESDN